MMRNGFDAYREFLKAVAKLLEKRVKDGKCAGKVIKWRRV